MEDGRVKIFDLKKDADSKDASRVLPFAPGPDLVGIALSPGIWRKLLGRVGYERAARLPYVRDYKSRSSITGMAFDPGRGSLTLVRNITAKDDTGRGETVTEVWDAVGLSVVARVATPEEVGYEDGVFSLGFKPGGQSFAAIMTTQVPYEFLGTDYGPQPAQVSRIYRTGDGAQVSDGRFEWKQRLPEDGGEQLLYTAPDAAHMITECDGSMQVLDVWGKRKVPVLRGDAQKTATVAAVGFGGKSLALTVNGTKSEPLFVVYRLDGESYREWKSIPRQGEAVTSRLATPTG
jgi:hypothetical protein